MSYRINRDHNNEIAFYLILTVVKYAHKQNKPIPSKPPILSATASISSMLRPRKVSNPCISSIKQPSPTAMRNIPIREVAVRMGREHSHKKVKPPNNTRCTHLSISGTSTLGISFPGVKQPIKISKVHSIAKNLACFVYGESGLKIRVIMILLMPGMRLHPIMHPPQPDSLIPF